MNLIWLLRMAKWVRHPPSKRQVRIMLVVAACVLLVLGLDWLGLWPDWAKSTPQNRQRIY
ncbi:hypothetical protein RPE78_12505 [Thioclava litoralis]|uniref:Uncharacterized protein n=1 Tax=Thioclava litoralis TaxID=3076557 RepID=A0ABZ1E071_9RHOB|nr:hypothetical protein RPE78_12505 [Thioclava sp. FTW29]